MFKVGQRVVCVDDDWDYVRYWRDNVPNKPRRGRFYTVRQVVKTKLTKGAYGIRLEEIANPIVEWDDGRSEGAFRSRHFRPIEPGETSIEIFERMLTGVQEIVE